MKNLFKFTFLGLALTVAFASCGGAETKTEAAVDSLATAVDSTITATVDSTVATVVDSTTAAVDSVAKNVQ